MEVKSLFEQLLFTTVRIKTTIPKGNSTGTGFIFNYVHNGKSFPFLVSNKHVVENSIEGWIEFNLAKDNQPDLGNIHTIHYNNFRNQWFFHPNPEVDVAISPLGPIVNQLAKNNIAIFYRSISNDIVPTEEVLKEIDAVEDVIIVGYPNGLYDTKHLLPIVRKGITATPANIDFDNQPKFLIDASIFPGSSGSPVFICNVGSFTKKGENTLYAGNRIIFLGIVASVYVRTDMNQLEIIQIPTKDIPVVKSSQMIDLGIVYKASCITEVIEIFLKQAHEI